MMDDIAAGFFTIIILTIFFFYIGGWTYEFTQRKSS
jgi:hypothetical protein